MRSVYTDHKERKKKGGKKGTDKRGLKLTARTQDNKLSITHVSLS